MQIIFIFKTIPLILTVCKRNLILFNILMKIFKKFLTMKNNAQEGFQIALYAIKLKLIASSVNAIIF